MIKGISRIRIIVWVCAVACLFVSSMSYAAVSIGCSSSTGSVVINEFYSGGNGQGALNFVELFVLDTIDVTGWKIKVDDSSETNSYSLSSFATVNIGDYIVINVNNINPAKGEILLEDSAGNAVDYIYYGSIKSNQKVWSVAAASACATEYPLHSSSQKDVARGPNGSGDFIDNGDAETQNASNDSVVTAPDATLEYRMDECFWNGSPSEVIEAISGQDGVAMNGATTANSDSVGGGICQVGVFNGTNYVDAGNVANDILGSTSNAITVTAWIKPSALTTVKTNHNTANTFIAKASDSYNDNLEIGVTAGGKLHLYLDTKRKDKYSDIGGGITANAWHFVAVTYDNGSVRVNIDGVESTSNDWSGGGNIDTAIGSPLTIGSSLHVDNYFNGFVDEVKLFSDALNTAQVQTIYQRELAGENYDDTVRFCKCVPTLLDLHFDECTFATGIEDYSGNNYQAVPHNGAESVSDGAVCRGASFDGADDYIEISNFPNLTGDSTITAWFKTNDRTERGQRIFADDENNSGGYAISVGDGGAGRVRFYHRGQPNSGIIDSDAVISNDTWYFVAAVTDVATQSRHLYVYSVAGEMLSHNELQISGSLGSDTGMASVGGETANGETANRFNGSLDEVKIYGSGLDQDSIKTIAENEGHGFNADGSVRDCPCCINYTGAITPVHFEGGELKLKNTYGSDKTWTDVVFNKPFQVAPEIFIVLEKSGGDPASVRVKDITVNGFKAAILEPQGEDGPHIAQTVNFFAINNGVHKIGGQFIEVGETSVAAVQQASQGSLVVNSWQTVTPQVPFCDPVVVANIQSMNNEENSAQLPVVRSKPWITTAIKIEDGNVKLALERSETNEGSVDKAETVAYMIAQSNVQDSFVDDLGTTIEFETIKTDPLFVGWDDSCRTVSFVNSYDKVPLIAANKNSKNEVDGGWFRRCSLSTTGAGFQVDEDRYYKTKYGSSNPPQDKERSHTAEIGGVFVFSGNFVLTEKLDHFQFIHDGHGLTCAAETVTIKAWVDADETVPFVGNVQVTLPDLGWLSGISQTLNFPATGAGVPLKLQHTTPGTVTLNVESSDPLAAAGVQCDTGATESCYIVFADTGFVINVDNGRSCTGINGTIQAVQKDDTTNVCVGDDSFAGQTKDVGFWFAYSQPNDGKKVPNVNDAPIGKTQTSSGTSLSFNGNAQATFQVKYNDAGSLSLHARHEGSGNSAGLVMEGSTTAAFVVAPDHFEVISPLNNIGASGAPKAAAGSSFAATVKAVCGDGSVTPNYAWPTLFTPQATFEPSAGVLGALAHGSLAAADFTDGRADTDVLSYSEVGNFTLQAYALHYLGSSLDISGTSNVPVGRFYPDYFDVTVNSPVFAAGCTSFTYLGQPFDFDTQPEITITAKNALGGTTQNYIANWWKLEDISNNCIDSTMPVGVNVDLSQLAHSPLTNTADVATPGAVKTTFSGPLAYVRPVSGAPVAPFDSALHLAFTVDDGDAKYSSDGVFDLPLPFRIGDGTEFRFGRLRMDNANGSELLELHLPIYVEYYDGIGFISNSDDSCGIFDVVALSCADVDTADGLGCANVAISGTGIGNGEFFTLSAPDNSATGSLQYTLNVDSWLQYDWDNADNDNDPLTGQDNPTARATFGIYKGSKSIIYLRETTWRH